MPGVCKHSACSLVGHGMLAGMRISPSSNLNWGCCLQVCLLVTHPVFKLMCLPERYIGNLLNLLSFTFLALCALSSTLDHCRSRMYILDPECSYEFIFLTNRLMHYFLSQWAVTMLLKINVVFLFFFTSRYGFLLNLAAFQRHWWGRNWGGAPLTCKWEEFAISIILLQFLFYSKLRKWLSKDKSLCKRNYKSFSECLLPPLWFLVDTVSSEILIGCLGTF